MIRSSSKKIAVTALTLATLVANFSFAAINSENHEIGNSALKTTLNVSPGKVTSTSQTSYVFSEAQVQLIFVVEPALQHSCSYWVQAGGQQPELPTPAEVSLSNLD